MATFLTFFGRAGFLSFAVAFLFFRETSGPPFRHSTHLHMAEHGTPAWKHSQYFLRHSDFLQLQPFRCLAVDLSIRPLLEPRKKALESRSSVARMAFSRIARCASTLQQLEQLQRLEHMPCLAKHSQYSLRHLDFLQLQGLCFSSPSAMPIGVVAGTVLCIEEAEKQPETFRLFSGLSSPILTQTTGTSPPELKRLTGLPPLEEPGGGAEGGVEEVEEAEGEIGLLIEPRRKLGVLGLGEMVLGGYGHIGDIGAEEYLLEIGERGLEPFDVRGDVRRIAIRERRVGVRGASWSIAIRVLTDWSKTQSILSIIPSPLLRISALSPSKGDAKVLERVRLLLPRVRASLPEKSNFCT